MDKLQFVYVSDMQPVQYGEWLSRGDFGTGMWECTVCKRWCEIKGNLYNYCPHCGAKMDGRTVDGNRQ